MAHTQQIAPDTPRSAVGRQILLLVGGLLILSGIVHLIVWWFSGGDWSGPLSWRKPILFGISGGITIISLGWVMSKLRRRPGDSWLAVVLAVAMLAEVALITLQTWRGVPSHFNRATPIDAAILAWINSLVLIVTVLIAELTRRSFGRLKTEPAMSLAIRVGMSLLLLSCLIGVAISIHGERQIAAGNSPEIYGKAGVVKFPHGVPMHAIQMLPCFVWMARRCGFGKRLRLKMTAVASFALIALTAFSITQTLAGRARFDVHLPSTSLLVVSGLLLLLSVFFPFVVSSRAKQHQE